MSLDSCVPSTLYICALYVCACPLPALYSCLIYLCLPSRLIFVHYIFVRAPVLYSYLIYSCVSPTLYSNLIYSCVPPLYICALHIHALTPPCIYDLYIRACHLRLIFTPYIFVLYIFMRAPPFYIHALYISACPHVLYSSLIYSYRLPY